MICLVHHQVINIFIWHSLKDIRDTKWTKYRLSNKYLSPLFYFENKKIEKYRFIDHASEIYDFPFYLQWFYHYLAA